MAVLSQAAVHVRSQAGQAEPGSVRAWRPVGRSRMPRIPQRHVVHSQPYELGEDAPGTGRRQFPETIARGADDELTMAVREEAVDFQKKSTQECYAEFPGLVRSSFPLYIRSAGPQEPLGEVEKRVEDGGPTTGNRRRPDPVDPVDPCYYDQSQEELLKQVQMRRSC